MKTIHSKQDYIIEAAVRFAKDKMKNLRPSHGWDHVQRVIALSERIAKTEDADGFVVKVSAILHDIAREIEDDNGGEICHAELGSRMAYEFLLTRGLNEHSSGRIALCIKTHRFRNNDAPDSIESKILYDADKLDSIGAVGIGRAFLFSGEIGAKLHNLNIDVTSTDAYSEEDTAYREYIVKLQHVKEKMLTAEGRKLAKGRHIFMVEFFDHIKAEIDGEI